MTTPLRSAASSFFYFKVWNQAGDFNVIDDTRVVTNMQCERCLTTSIPNYGVWQPSTLIARGFVFIFAILVASIHAYKIRFSIRGLNLKT